MIKDHMHNPDNPKRTRCGKPIGNLPGPRIIAWEYGSPKTTCKACLRLHAKDQLDLLISKAKPSLPRKYYKCARTDCGVAGCECSSLDPEPPEFCVYDNDEAHWDEIKGGDDE